MKKRITGETTIGEVAQLPEWESIKDYIFEARKATKENAMLFRFDKYDFHGANRILDGFNFVDEYLCTITQNVAFDYYTEEEIEADPDLKMTKLMFFKGKPQAPFILVVPGGGYHNVAVHLEGFSLAKGQVEAGFNVFVMTYRTRVKELLPKPMLDIRRALEYIRDNREYFEIGEKYGVVGCSAGAHLTAELVTDNFGCETFGYPLPSAITLSYAPNNASFASDLIADGYKLEDFDILKHIKSNCPPVYIWHCKNDPLVPFATFEATVRKLEELNIPHETRVYEEGGHGLQSEHKAEEDDWITPVAVYFRRTIK